MTPTITDVQTRLLGDVMPAGAQALLDAGHPLSYVTALYKPSLTGAQTALINRLREVANLEYSGQILTFMEHVSKVWGAQHVRWRREFRDLADIAMLAGSQRVQASTIEQAVGRTRTERFGSGYRTLERLIEVLSLWASHDDTIWDEGQAAAFEQAATVWFAILDFDWRW